MAGIRRRGVSPYGQAFRHAREHQSACAGHHVYTVRDTDTHRYTDCYCHSDSYGHINGNSYRDSPTHANAKVWANAESAAHSISQTLIASERPEVITDRIL